MSSDEFRVSGSYLRVITPQFIKSDKKLSVLEENGDEAMKKIRKESENNYRIIKKYFRDYSLQDDRAIITLMTYNLERCINSSLTEIDDYQREIIDKMMKGFTFSKLMPIAREQHISLTA